MDNKEIELITQIPRLMNIIKHKLLSGFHNSLHNRDLSFSQWRVLLFIFDHKRLTMTELHYMTGLEKGSLTSLIDQLIDKGLVDRNHKEKDRRKVFVSLTASGRKQAAVAQAEIALFIKNRLAHLSSAHREKLARAIKNILDIVEQL